MKTLAKNTSIILTVLTLTSCGLVNANYTIGYNIVKAVTPHSHKVKREGENSFPENGKAIVSLNFIDGYEKSKVGTLWRKINEDGTFSKRISLTYWESFSDSRVQSMIEPGTYFLDGLRYNNGKNFVAVGAFSALISYKQKGWDKEKNEPIWFKFTAKKGEELFVPNVEVFVTCHSGFDRCEGDDVQISMKIVDNEEKAVSKPYKIGHKVRQQ